MFFLLAILLFFNEMIAVGKKNLARAQQIHQEVFVKNTHRGSRVFIPIEKYYKSDFDVSPEALVQIVQQRIEKFLLSQQMFEQQVDSDENYVGDTLEENYGDFKELFNKHHLTLLVLAFHREDVTLFKELRKLSDLDTITFSWAEFKKNDDGYSEEQKTGTIKNYIEIYCRDDAGEKVPQLSEYWQIMQTTP